MSNIPDRLFEILVIFAVLVCSIPVEMAVLARTRLVCTALERRTGRTFRSIRRVWVVAKFFLETSLCLAFDVLL
jgi:hypothetical protein